MPQSYRDIATEIVNEDQAAGHQKAVEKMRKEIRAEFMAKLNKRMAGGNAPYYPADHYTPEWKYYDAPDSRNLTPDGQTQYAYDDINRDERVDHLDFNDHGRQAWSEDAHIDPLPEGMSQEMFDNANSDEYIDYILGAYDPTIRNAPRRKPHPTDAYHYNYETGMK